MSPVIGIRDENNRPIKAGLTTSATRKVLYLLQHGRKQPLVRWGAYNGEDELLCYIDIRTDADGSQDTYGVPVEAVTPDMVRRFAESVLGKGDKND